MRVIDTNDLRREAMTAYEQTGLTPSQLQARAAELEVALQMVRAVHGQTNPNAASWIEVRRVLERHQ